MTFFDKNLLCCSTGIFNFSAAFSFKNDTVQLNSMSSIRCFEGFLPSLMQTHGIITWIRHKTNQLQPCNWFFDKKLFSTSFWCSVLTLVKSNAGANQLSVSNFIKQSSLERFERVALFTGQWILDSPRTRISLLEI